MKVEESRERIRFGVSRKFRRVVRIERSMIKFKFKLNKNKKFMKVEESRVRFIFNWIAKKTNKKNTSRNKRKMNKNNMNYLYVWRRNERIQRR